MAYRLKEHAGGDAWGDIYVVLNARKETAKVSVPEGKYTVVCKDGFISEKGLGTMYGRRFQFRHSLRLFSINKRALGTRMLEFIPDYLG